MLGSIVDDALFFKPFPKTHKKWILVKIRKRIQVSVHIHSKHIVFLGFFSDIWILSYFKVVSRTESKLWHNQNPRYIKNPSNIPCDIPAYEDSWYMQNLGILRTWGIFRITWISRIQFTQNFLWPCHLRPRGIFRTLSNIYNEAFCSELCVTLAYLKPWHVQNLRNIWNPVKHLWCSIFLRTLCNPGMFRTLVYAEPEE